MSIIHATASAAEKMQLTDPNTYPPYLPTLWVVAAVLVAGICLINPVFRRIEIVGTLAHELGHGLGGVLAGRKFDSFSLHPDASGVTQTTGAGRLGLIFCFWSGYAAPGTVAVMMAATMAWGAPNWAYLIVAAIMILCLLKIRSLTTLVIVVGVGAACIGMWWLDEPVLQSTILAAFIGYFLMTGLRQIADAWRQRKTDGGNADGDALAELTFIPEAIWLILFFAYTIACTAITIALLAPSA